MTESGPQSPGRLQHRPNGPRPKWRPAWARALHRLGTGIAEEEVGERGGAQALRQPLRHGNPEQVRHVQRTG